MEFLVEKLPRKKSKSQSERRKVVYELAKNERSPKDISTLSSIPEPIVLKLLNERSLSKQQKLRFSKNILNLFKEGSSFKDIAALCYISKAQVKKILEEYPEFHSKEIIALSNEGVSYQEIAKHCSISEVAVSNYLNEHNQSYKEPKQNISERKQQSLEQIKKIFELYMEGHTCKHIGDIFGISTATVYQTLHRNPEYKLYVEERKTQNELRKRETQEHKKRKIYGNSLSKRIPKQKKETLYYEKRVSQRKQQSLEKSKELLELYKQGLVYKNIGEKFGITHERVRQILNIHPEFELYVEERKTQKESRKREIQEHKKLKIYENSLSKRFPKQTAEFWDYTKNINLNPEKVPAGSNKVVWWKCPLDGNSWKKKLISMAESWKRGNRGCPVCAGKKPLVKRPTLLIAYPEYVNQYWDFPKNDALKLWPYILTAGSNRKAWFKCPKDGYEWEATIGQIAYQQWSKGSAGCKVCNGTVNNKLGNRTKRDPLIVEFPSQIEKYWDYDKNNALNLRPEKILGGSSKKAWFKCPVDGHEWQSVVSQVAVRWKRGNTGCARCKRSSRKRPSLIN